MPEPDPQAALSAEEMIAFYYLRFCAVIDGIKKSELLAYIPHKNSREQSTGFLHLRKEANMEKERSAAEGITVPASCEMNLSDFALFLSVMKNKEAYQNTLSIIMEEPDLELTQVKVEQVVLNKSGKRAIRLDAWAQDKKDRRFNTEMQNDTSSDDVRKRSRFYQGMLDTPVLKSGKKTRYRNLPSTVIIFITQEDIFGKDLAKYTFTEQCEEIRGLHLEDGTSKIFLNMTSKNGEPELISLLQYMKDTRLDNPDILIKDKRLVRLDEIVGEVRQSEEWEAVKMNILEIGIAQGEARGEIKGEKKKLIQLVCRKLQKGKTPEIIADELEEEPELIGEICTAARKYAPEYDCEKIYKELNQ